MNDESSSIKSRSKVARMLKNSQTKVIMPVVLLGLLRAHQSSGQTQFADREIKTHYEAALAEMRVFLGHSLHIGARYYDAYGSRMSRYGVLESIGHLVYSLAPSFQSDAVDLGEYIPLAIRDHIQAKLGSIPELADHTARSELAQNSSEFFNSVSEHIGKNPANFEIFSFALIKVHLEIRLPGLPRYTNLRTRQWS